MVVQIASLYVHSFHAFERIRFVLSLIISPNWMCTSGARCCRNATLPCRCKLLPGAVWAYRTERSADAELLLCQLAPGQPFENPTSVMAQVDQYVTWALWSTLIGRKAFLIAFQKWPFKILQQHQSFQNIHFVQMFYAVTSRLKYFKTACESWHTLFAFEICYFW